MDTAALANVLVTEADDVDMSSFGPIPMTSTMTRDDSYYDEPPTELCDDEATTELVAADHLSGYMGDGGDYLSADQWVSGEGVDAASRRFAIGVAALERCAEAGELRASTRRPVMSTMSFGTSARTNQRRQTTNIG